MKLKYTILSVFGIVIGLLIVTIFFFIATFELSPDTVNEKALIKIPYQGDTLIVFFASPALSVDVMYVDKLVKNRRTRLSVFFGYRGMYSYSLEDSVLQLMLSRQSQNYDNIDTFYVNINSTDTQFYE